ncbi:hypothetical protein ANCDUO_14605 [Ancylostoma duodenale]|uniref:Uncharacterized protein n=1 Tax=Ancylostoma duodenale TaxID=51022 RepID=A0A0C2CZL4_9BILA|nr:hypothetical protein ANCDUO_14605 [Ancylostoma duodenale]
MCATFPAAPEYKHSLMRGAAPTSNLPETAFCSFFDLNVAQLLRQCVTLVPRSRAHLHALMFLGKYDLMHEAAQPVEKIICATYTGEIDMVTMWYDGLIAVSEDGSQVQELVHEYLNEQPVGWSYSHSRRSSSS